LPSPNGKERGTTDCGMLGGEMSRGRGEPGVAMVYWGGCSFHDAG